MMDTPKNVIEHSVLYMRIYFLGMSVMPMIVSLLGACAFRIVWIYTIFKWNRILHTLYISYPVSWSLTAFAHMVCFIVVRRKLDQNKSEE